MDGILHDDINTLLPIFRTVSKSVIEDQTKKYEPSAGILNENVPKI